LSILTGIVLAIWLGDRRWQERGGRPGTVLDIAAWAVPFGILGGRLYHVTSSWQPYFGPGGDPWSALYIWHGGLGIWGAVALGGVGAWIGARRRGILLPPFADAIAPGIILAQAVGRLGNWFNNELYGGPTSLPWGLTVHEWDSVTGRAVTDVYGDPVVLGTFHPTFLYELLWNLGVFAVLLWADRRFRMGHGRVFAAYVALYTVGRFWIEMVRIDPANTVLGVRLNVWTSAFVFLGAVGYLWWSARRFPGRDTVLYHEGRQPPETGEGLPKDEERSTEAATPGKSPEDAENSSPDDGDSQHGDDMTTDGGSDDETAGKLPVNRDDP
jgi:prolipoprotein diacylglyceryl transferase